MGTVLNQGISAILDNYADVIEGGNSWRGSGTAYRGIPGTQPNDPELRDGTDSIQTVVGSSVSTTTFDVTGVSWDQSRWVKDNIPGYWALCSSSAGAASAQNLNQARKITGYNNTTKVFTIAPALDVAPIASDEFTILQGFKRIPNQHDIEDAELGIANGFDRFFHLRIGAGERLSYYGAGYQTFRSTLELRLRFLKHGREHDVVASAFENLSIIRAAISKGASPDHRDGTYTRAMWPEGAPSIAVEDRDKIVVMDTYTLMYRINAEFN